MKKIKKIGLRAETVRVLAGATIELARGGQSQGAACDNTVGKTQCDLQGCAYQCTDDSCQICDTLTWQGGTCTTPAA